MKTLFAYILGFILTLSFIANGYCQSILSEKPVMAKSSPNDEGNDQKASKKADSEEVKESKEAKKKKKESCKRKEAEEEASVPNLYFTTP